jgi:hypothetical protein
MRDYVRQNHLVARVSFHGSASKHGISRDRVTHVIANCPCPLYPTDPRTGEEDLVLFLWSDQGGVPLDVIAVQLADDELLVIHSMRMRAKYSAQYAEVMKCR